MSNFEETFLKFMADQLAFSEKLNAQLEQMTQTLNTIDQQLSLDNQSYGYQEGHLRKLACLCNFEGCNEEYIEPMEEDDEQVLEV